MKLKTLGQKRWQPRRRMPPPQGGEGPNRSDDGVCSQRRQPSTTPVRVLVGTPHHVGYTLGVDGLALSCLVLRQVPAAPGHSNPPKSDTLLLVQLIAMLVVCRLTTSLLIPPLLERFFVALVLRRESSRPPAPRLTRACLTVLRLLHERGLGASSPFHPYLSILPQDHRLPLEWNEAELELLQVAWETLQRFPKLDSLLANGPTTFCSRFTIVGLLPRHSSLA